jgi:hypothetical protein
MPTIPAMVAHCVCSDLTEVRMVREQLFRITEQRQQVQRAGQA